MRARRWTAAAAALAATPLTVAAPEAAAAEATEYRVSTTEDAVDPADEVLSLREAVQASNADGTDSVIRLAEGETYTVTRCDASQGDADAVSAAGELDVTSAVTITGAATLTTTCPETTLLHLLPGALGTSTIEGVEFVGNDDAPAIQARSDLSLRQVVVRNAGRAGLDVLEEPVASDAAVVAERAEVRVEGSVLRDNAIALLAGPGSAIQTTGSKVTDNEVAAFGSEAARLHVTDSLLTRSQIVGVVCLCDELVLERSQVLDNASDPTGPGSVALFTNRPADERSGPAGRISDSIIWHSGGPAVHLYDASTDPLPNRFVVERSEIRGDIGIWSGSGTLSVSDSAIRASELGILSDGDLLLERSTVSEADVGVLTFDTWGDHDVRSVEVDSSTFADNDVGISSPGNLRVVNSTFSGNATAAIETVSDGDEVRVEHSTFAGNGAAFDGTGFHVAASVVDGPCDGGVVSGGFNVFTDDSCAGGAPGPGDAVVAGPLVGPLNDNGGPTLTHLPLAGEILDRVPVDVCTVDRDQRGEPRPAGDACDAGSVELDAPECLGRTPTLVGTEAADVLVGTSGPDVIVGLGGDDHIIGLGGDDIVCGGRGNDRIQGSDGNDALLGGPGDDVLRDHAGVDWLFGEDGRDDLEGGPGGDLIGGGEGDDEIAGLGGDDIISGGHGDDRIDAGPGDDVVRAGPDDDLVRGGPGNDTIHGGDGHDDVYGSAGDDTIDGGDGHDDVVASSGDDVVRGGNGDDDLRANDGDDTIDGGPGTDVCFPFDQSVDCSRTPFVPTPIRPF